jgi:PAS domain-containing protein
MSHTQGDVARSLHPALREQLGRHLGASADGVLPPELAGTGARLRPLFEAVSAVYRVADRALLTYEAVFTPPDPGVRHQELRRAARSYRAVFEQHPVPTLVYDPETRRVLAANAAAIALLGCAADALAVPFEVPAAARVAERPIEFDGRSARLVLLGVREAARG